MIFLSKQLTTTGQPDPLNSSLPAKGSELLAQCISVHGSAKHLVEPYALRYGDLTNENLLRNHLAVTRGIEAFAKCGEKEIREISQALKSPLDKVVLRALLCIERACKLYLVDRLNTPPGGFFLSLSLKHLYSRNNPEIQKRLTRIDGWREILLEAPDCNPSVRRELWPKLNPTALPSLLENPECHDTKRIVSQLHSIVTGNYTEEVRRAAFFCLASVNSRAATYAIVEGLSVTPQSEKAWKRAHEELLLSDRRIPECALPSLFESVDDPGTHSSIRVLVSLITLKAEDAGIDKARKFVDDQIHAIENELRNVTSAKQGEGLVLHSLTLRLAKAHNEKKFPAKLEGDLIDFMVRADNPLLESFVSILGSAPPPKEVYVRIADRYLTNFLELRIDPIPAADFGLSPLSNLIRDIRYFCKNTDPAVKAFYQRIRVELLPHFEEPADRDDFEALISR